MMAPNMGEAKAMVARAMAVMAAAGEVIGWQLL